jgi:hypothetical protein
MKTLVKKYSLQILIYIELNFKNFKKKLFGIVFIYVNLWGHVTIY